MGSRQWGNIRTTGVCYRIKVASNQVASVNSCFFFFTWLETLSNASSAQRQHT